MRLSQDENSSAANVGAAQAQPRLIGKTSTTSLSTAGRLAGKTVSTTTSGVAVGKATALPGPRRALGDVSNAGAAVRVSFAHLRRKKIVVRM